MTATNSIDLERDPRSIIGTRLFDAPRDLVFSVWTDPKHLAQWWGPYGFTTTTSSFDMRPGGVWRFVMHGPDGTDYENRITYDEIVRPERLVYRLFHERGVRVFRTMALTAQCSCSRTGVANMLRSFPQDDRDQMVENGVITVTCEFCNSSYVFEPVEVRDQEIGDQEISDQGSANGDQEPVSRVPDP